jgi:hypothetical protein
MEENENKNGYKDLVSKETEKSVGFGKGLVNILLYIVVGLVMILYFILKISSPLIFLLFGAVCFGIFMAPACFCFFGCELLFAKYSLSIAIPVTIVAVILTILLTYFFGYIWKFYFYILGGLLDFFGFNDVE